MFASSQGVAAWSPERLDAWSPERLEVWLLEQAGFGLVQAWLQVWLFAEIRARQKLRLGYQARAPRPVRLQEIWLKSRRLRATGSTPVGSAQFLALVRFVLLHQAVRAPLRQIGRAHV